MVSCSLWIYIFLFPHWDFIAGRDREEILFFLRVCRFYFLISGAKFSCRKMVPIASSHSRWECPVPLPVASPGSSPSAHRLPSSPPTSTTHPPRPPPSHQPAGGKRALVFTHLATWGEGGHLFVSPLALWISSFVSLLFTVLAYFLLGCLSFPYWFKWNLHIQNLYIFYPSMHFACISIWFWCLLWYRILFN